MKIISKEPQQYLIFLGSSLAVALLTGIGLFRRLSLFQPFFGKIHPIVAIVIVVLAGAFLLTLLIARGWFAIYLRGNYIGLSIAAGLGLLLALLMILLDLNVVLPENVNRPFPDSLYFYPVMGFVVEIVFHVLPLTIFLIALTSFFKNLKLDWAFWPCILVIALFETAYQVEVGLSRPYPGWVLGAIGILVFFVNFFELVLFKRYDFISMYTLRLSYYFVWHIGWGYLRLRLLF